MKPGYYAFLAAVGGDIHRGGKPNKAKAPSTTNLPKGRVPNGKPKKVSKPNGKPNSAPKSPKRDPKKVGSRAKSARVLARALDRFIQSSVDSAIVPKMKKKKSAKSKDKMPMPFRTGDDGYPNRAPKLPPGGKKPGGR